METDFRRNLDTFKPHFNWHYYLYVLKRTDVLELHGIVLALEISVNSRQTVLRSILHLTSNDEGFQ
jgi:hypothetical protein